MTDKNRNEKGQWVEGNDASVGNEGGAPSFFKDVEHFQSCIDGYLDSISEDRDGARFFREPPILAGLPFYAGCSKDAVYTATEKSEFADAYKRFRAICEYYSARALNRSKGQVAGHIFNLKVNYGWKEVNYHDVDAKVDNALQITVVSEKQVDDDDDDDYE